MKRFPLFVCCFLVANLSLLNAQNVGIGTPTPNASAKLHVESTNSGLLIPRVSLVNISNATSPVNAPATGLMVWNTNAAVTGGNGIGFYCWDGSQWLKLVSSNAALPTQDHDFYEVGTTTPPNAITDNIFTMGSMGVGTNTPGHRLDISNGNTSLDNYLYLKDFDDATESVNLISRDNALMGWTGGWVVGQYADGALPAGFGVTGTLLTRGQSAFAVSVGNVGIGNTTPETKLDLRNFPLQWANRSALNTDQGGSIELGAGNAIAGLGTPFIDFHYNGLTQDFNTRIINSANGELTFVAPTRSAFSNGVRMAALPASVANTSVVTLNATGDLETRTIPADIWDGDANTIYTAGTGLSLTGTTFANTAPDQTVTLTGAGATTIGGTYPNFTITSTDNNTTYTAGTGLTLTGTTFSNNFGTSIESGEITDGTITATDLNQMGATANQVLSWNGTNWTPATPANDGDWLFNGTHIYSGNSGNVGIGTTTPAQKLDVWGGNTSVDNYFIIKDAEDQTENSRMISRDGSFMTWNGGFVVGQYADGALPAGFNATGTFLTNNMTALAANAGNVGIGNTTPEVKLDLRNFPLQWANRSALNTDQGGSIELGAGNANAGLGTPFIDFHYNGLTQDFNTRIINSANGELTFVAPTRSAFSNGVRMAALPASVANTSVVTLNATGDLETRTIPADIWDGDANTTYTAGTGLSLTGTTFANTAPDQTVTLTGAGATTIGGTYPNFTITSTDNNTTYIAGTGLSLTGTTFANTAPDQTVTLTGAGATTIGGTYPNFTITSTDNNTTYTAGTGLTLTGTTFSNNLGTSIESVEITDGTIAAADLNQMGATANQVLTWNGTNWTPADPAADHDWYEVGGTTAPDNINDNKFTFGKIGMGINNPVANLHIVGVDGVLATGTFGSGIIPATGAGTRMMWYPNKAAFRTGHITGTQWDDANIGIYSVAFGYNNTASNQASTVFGYANTNSGQNSSIGGGSGNNVSGVNTVIAGGSASTASGSYAAIGGGQTNSALANYTTIGGGRQNRASGVYDVVIGGENNFINSLTGYNLLGGGFNNTIPSGTHSTISGGRQNSSSDDYTFIGGGLQNEITSTDAEYSSIVGGRENTITGFYGVIGGGNRNELGTGYYSGIFSGQSNIVTGNSSGILSGSGNSVASASSAIGAGLTNSVTGPYAFLGAGRNDTITTTGVYGFLGAGYSNYLNMRFAAIVGGVNNEITGSNGPGVDSSAFIGAGRDNLSYHSHASVIGGGISNDVLSSDWAVIVGGGQNTINNNSLYSFLGAGSGNTISSADYSVISGGLNNNISPSSDYAAILSGRNNTLGLANPAAHSIIGGGANNQINSIYSFVGSGTNNSINTGAYSVIAGGQANSMASTNTHNTIGGGYQNIMPTGGYSVISGGRQNTSSDDYNFIGGGFTNQITGANAEYSSITGGRQNTLTGLYGVIGGGYLHQLGGLYSGIFSGNSNIVSGNFAVVLGGSGNSVTGICSSIGTGQQNNVQSGRSFLGAGQNDTITGLGEHSFLGAGFDNHLDMRYSVIGGGLYNSISGSNVVGSVDSMAFIGAGRNNISYFSNASVIVGGTYNEVTSADYGIIVGGYHNTITNGVSSFIGGGNSNTVSNWRSAIVSGFQNTNSSQYGFIGAGQNNNASGNYAIIVGGVGNTASGAVSFVGGGQNHLINSSHGTISGGSTNSITASFGTIGGGGEHSVQGNYGTVAGGQANFAIGVHSSILGGQSNGASGTYSSISGGRQNSVFGTAGFIGAGTNNNASGNYAFIGAGQNNIASGQYSFVGGGFFNVASGIYSTALGYYAHTNNQTGSFVYSDASSGVYTVATAPNQFMVRAAGGTIFYSNAAMTAGVQLATGAGAWATISDKNKKENFADTDGEAVLAKIAKMPITTWNYISQEDKIRHIGPMAQDFYAAFQLGESDTTITTTDIDGISLLAIQTLEARSRQLQAENEAQAIQIAELKALLQQKENETTRLQSLETRLQNLEAALKNEN